MLGSYDYHLARSLRQFVPRPQTDGRNLPCRGQSRSLSLRCHPDKLQDIRLLEWLFLMEWCRDPYPYYPSAQDRKCSTHQLWDWPAPPSLDRRLGHWTVLH